MELWILITLLAIGAVLCLLQWDKLYSMLLWHLRRPVPGKETSLPSVAVLIPAHNEEATIVQLIESLKKQDYTGKADIFVGADRCDDKTAALARSCGAEVLELTENPVRRKAYVLAQLDALLARRGMRYDAFLIADADNLFDPGFLSAAVKKLNHETLVTGRRMCKNMDTNAVSAVSGMLFLFNSMQDAAKTRAGLNAFITGTGYLIPVPVLERLGGWAKLTCLTEDMELCARCTQNGIRIEYAEDAIYYDEQPVSWKDVYFQRVRWCQGAFDVTFRYGKQIFRRMLRGCKQSLFWIFYIPLTMLYPIFMCLAVLAFLVYGLVSLFITGPAALFAVLAALAVYLVMFYLICLFGSFPVIREYGAGMKISRAKRYGYAFLWPFSILLFIPILFTAMTTKEEWRKMEHSDTRSISDIEE